MLIARIKTARARLGDALAVPLSHGVRASAIDITSEINGGRLLVIAPHPDDETLSSGITIQRVLRSGGTVTVVVASDGRHAEPDRVHPEAMIAIRRDELRSAVATLGLDPLNLISLEMEDRSLAAHEAALRTSLQAIIDQHRPSLVISPSPYDSHPDHAALGRVSRRLMASHQARHLEYLIWGWNQPLHLINRVTLHGEGVTRTSRRYLRPVVVSDHRFEEAKIDALRCYSSQFSTDAMLSGHRVGGIGPIGIELFGPLNASSETFFTTRS